MSASRRPPATIVILAWNAWDSTRACLESLRPTLGVRDQVVVVDNGSVDATASQLPKYPWVEVVTNVENRGFAGGCNDGAAVARHDLLVFLNNDTVLTGKWLDALLVPFSADDVGAAGPRSNFVSGPQVAEGASYLNGDMAGMRSFARSWAQTHRGQTTDTDRLVGFCLAVRRSAYEALGGFDEAYEIGGYEDDDLCRRLLHDGWRLVIAHESFVHHEGHKTFDANDVDWTAQELRNRDRFVDKFGGGSSRDFPLVSACLIVKNESQNLPTCLASLEGFADEVIVYDTGSDDGTPELARTLGATVIEGYWDDDFSRARNAALDHCRGQWIAWLDADETLVCDDVEGLRRLLLATSPGVDGYSVTIENLTGSGVGSMFFHSAARLFRRARCEWTGRLHEQVAGRGDHRSIVQALLETARIHHTGYLDAVMIERNKHERNLRLAEAELSDDSGWDQGYSLTNVGRSYMSAGNFEQALEYCRRGAQTTANAITRRLALRGCAEASMGLARFDESLAWIAELRAASTAQVLCDILEGTVALAMGEPDRALATFAKIGPSQYDDDGFEYRATTLAVQKAQALAALGRPGEAADALLAALFDVGVLDTHLGTLVDHLQAAGRPLTELAGAIPADRVALFLAQVLQLQPEVGDLVLDALFSSHPSTTEVLAAAANLARRLPVDRALVWSVRLRTVGLAASCPLAFMAGQHPDPVQRARAAATVVRAFGDRSAEPDFHGALRMADAGQRAVIVEEVTALCPELVAGLEAASAPAPETPRASDPDPDRGDVRVSIVIPCFNKAELTLACLQSMAGNPTTVGHEVIVVDNGSDDATLQLAGLQDSRFRVLRNDENLGFGRACNQGAAAARGEYVLFLNNDTLLTPGWLEPLVAALDEDDRLAAVQPKLLYPDGRLNDAGGLVFAGGDAWVYGKGAPDPAAPPYDCRRAPDYASGACLLVRRSAFDEVGGFDDRYAPAYYEDTDLSFALRAAGWTVLYEPASVVVHVEGGTAGTDVQSGLKQYQVRNKARFVEKWADELSWRPAMDPAVVEAWAHRAQSGFGPGESIGSDDARPTWAQARAAARDSRRILVVDPSMPVYDRASGSLRLFTLLRCLREAGHEVTFFAASGGDRRYARELGRFGVVCYGGDPHRFAPGTAYGDTYWPPIDGLLTARRFDTVLVGPWDTAEMMLPGLRRVAPDVLIIVDTNDVHFRRLERAAELSEDPSAAAEARETKRRELAAYALADRIVCVTDEDAASVRSAIAGAEVVVVPNAHAPLDPGPGFSGRHGCLFVGNFNHLPNGDAVAWWKDQIGPPLARALPGCGLTVVGNDPVGAAAAMAGPGIEVVGTVESTLPYLHAARVSVAPLRYGAGMKGKVGEALAAGLPLVATSMAVEGMGLVDGEHVLVADTAENFASAVALLHQDEDLWDRLRRAGRAHVEAHLGLGRMRGALDSLLAPARNKSRGERRATGALARR